MMKIEKNQKIEADRNIVWFAPYLWLYPERAILLQQALCETVDEPACRGGFRRHGQTGE
jgi:hypothetical protein